MCKELITTDGKKLYRVSRWIKINYAYNIRKNNQLAYYATDENGYRDGQKGYNPENGTYLNYFKWNGRKWAIDQFYRMDYPIMFEENSKLHYLAGYDSENYYNPIMIELSECCDYVRVYEE